MSELTLNPHRSSSPLLAHHAHHDQKHLSNTNNDDDIDSDNDVKDDDSNINNNNSNNEKTRIDLKNKEITKTDPSQPGCLGRLIRLVINYLKGILLALFPCFGEEKIPKTLVDKQIADLTKLRGEATAVAQKATQELETANNTITSLSSNLGDIKKINATINNDSKDKSTRINDLEALLTKANKNGDGLRNEVTHLNTVIDNTKQALQQKDKELVDLTTKHNTLIVQNKSAHTEVNKLSAANQQLGAAQDLLVKDRDTAIAENKGMLSLLQVKQDEVNQLKAQVVGLSNELTAVKDALTVAKSVTPITFPDVAVINTTK